MEWVEQIPRNSVTEFNETKLGSSIQSISMEFSSHIIIDVLCGFKRI